tara:strand:- start:180 stop:620 length:441 start_codon:yes stop_codon:yes gene_type:complete
MFNKIGLPKDTCYDIMVNSDYTFCKKQILENLFTKRNTTTSVKTINFTQPFKEKYERHMDSKGVLKRYRDDIVYCMKRLDTGLINEESLVSYSKQNSFQHFMKSMNNMIVLKYNGKFKRKHYSDFHIKPTHESALLQFCKDIGCDW